MIDSKLVLLNNIAYINTTKNDFLDISYVGFYSWFKLHPCEDGGVVSAHNKPFITYSLRSKK
jgi:hypothetical protein